LNTIMPKMTKSFDLRKPAAASARKVMRKLLETSAEDLRGAAQGAGVHAARRSIKRMRSVLRLVRPGLGTAAFRGGDRLMKEAADLLAGARQAEAFNAILAKLDISDAARSGALEHLRSLAGPEVTPDALADAARKSLDLVKQLQVELRRWRLPRRGRSFCIGGLKRSYALARRQLAVALRTEDAEALHEARKHVIHNLHHTEMLRGLWPEVMPAIVAELTVLREALGEINDLDELISAISGFAPADDAILSEIRAAIASLHGAHLLTARRKSAVLYAEKPLAYAQRIDAMWRAAAA
jgi:CHAD domain-containing protein